MTPQWPFKCPYKITQGYANKSDRYKNGVHLGLDILPLDAQGKGWPAPTYPILGGKTRYFYNEPHGNPAPMIAVDTLLDAPFISYLKTKGVIPQDYAGTVTLYHEYLHGLEILDKDGEVSQDTPIMKCGNTGMTYTGKVINGETVYVPVPENMKGVPPYPGLHLHLQCYLIGTNNKLLAQTPDNPSGTISPLIILNYKAMNEFVKILNYKGEVGIFIAAEDIPTLKALGKTFGRPVETDDQNNVTNADIVVN